MTAKTTDLEELIKIINNRYDCNKSKLMDIIMKLYDTYNIEQFIDVIKEHIKDHFYDNALEVVGSICKYLIEKDNLDGAILFLKNYECYKWMYGMIAVLRQIYDVEILKKIYEIYSDQELENNDHCILLDNACKYNTLDVAKWIYSLDDEIFTRIKCNNFHWNNYKIILENACKNNNLLNEKGSIAFWLASLYDLYKVEIKNGICKYTKTKFDEDMCIMSRISNFENKCKRLCIYKTYKKNNEKCLLCLDSNDKMIELNCGHYCCMDCIPNWYKNKQKICMLCKEKICWNESKKVSL